MICINVQCLKVVGIFHLTHRKKSKAFTLWHKKISKFVLYFKKACFWLWNQICNDYMLFSFQITKIFKEIEIPVIKLHFLEEKKIQNSWCKTMEIASSQLHKTLMKGYIISWIKNFKESCGSLRISFSFQYCFLFSYP